MKLLLTIFILFIAISSSYTLHKRRPSAISYSDDMGAENQCIHPPFSTCGFYRTCLERKFNCGHRGFPLYYGERYCNRFRKANARLSPKGSQWQIQTSKCIQTALVPFMSRSNGTCRELEQEGFRAYQTCFVENGFCELKFTDKALVAKAVKLKDMVSIKGLKQGVLTLLKCVAR